MLKITDFVMRFAPVGVFGAMAAAITTQGIGVLATYGKFIGGFYFGLIVLWIALIAVGYLFLSRPKLFGLPLGVVAVTEKAFHMPLLVVHAVLGMRHVIRPVAPDAMFNLL